MANRRFEMYQYRHVLVRMRMGESNRTIADSGLMGRYKLSGLRKTAKAQGWLNPDLTLPDDAQLAAVLGKPAAKSSTTSLTEPYHDEVKA